MARHKPPPTLDERERAVALREEAIATVMPYIAPALANLADMMRQVDEADYQRSVRLQETLRAIAERAKRNASVA